MRLRTIGWKLGARVRALMLASNETGPLRRLHKIVRRVPGVQALWRSIAGKSTHWTEVEPYIAGSGTFWSDINDDRHRFVAPPDFDNENYFTDLLMRIDACTPTIAPAPTPGNSARIILINNGLSSGGAERQIVYTLSGLKRRGFNVGFIGQYLDRAPDLDFYRQALLQKNIDITALPSIAAPGFTLYEPVSLPVAQSLAQMPPDMLLEILDMVILLRKKEPHIVHLWQDDTSTKHAISALIAGVPRIVLSGRNLNPTHFPFHLEHMHAAYRALAKHERITLSNNSAAGARSYGDWLDIVSGEIAVIYNGFDASGWKKPSPKTRQDFRAANGISLDAPLIAGVFRLAEEKRPILWLQAAAKVLQKQPDSRFVLAGVGPMRDKVLKYAVELGLSNNLVYLGEVKNVEDMLIASDIFLMTSMQEGTPNAVLEAQSYGLPCVVTEAGGTREAIKPGVSGMILPANANADLLGQTLFDIWKDVSFRKLAKRAGPELIKTSFGVERMIDDTLRLYQLKQN